MRPRLVMAGVPLAAALSMIAVTPVLGAGPAPRIVSGSLIVQGIDGGTGLEQTVRVRICGVPQSYIIFIRDVVSSRRGQFMDPRHVEFTQRRVRQTRRCQGFTIRYRLPSAFIGVGWYGTQVTPISLSSERDPFDPPARSWTRWEHVGD